MLNQQYGVERKSWFLFLQIKDQCECEVFTCDKYLIFCFLFHKELTENDGKVDKRQTRCIYNTHTDVKPSQHRKTREVPKRSWSVGAKYVTNLQNICKYNLKKKVSKQKEINKYKTHFKQSKYIMWVQRFPTLALTGH